MAGKLSKARFQREQGGGGMVPSEAPLVKITVAIRGCRRVASHRNDVFLSPDSRVSYRLGKEVTRATLQLLHFEDSDSPYFLARRLHLPLAALRLQLTRDLWPLAVESTLLKSQAVAPHAHEAWRAAAILIE